MNKLRIEILYSTQLCIFFKKNRSKGQLNRLDNSISQGHTRTHNQAGEAGRIGGSSNKFHGQVGTTSCNIASLKEAKCEPSNFTHTHTKLVVAPAPAPLLTK